MNVMEMNEQPGFAAVPFNESGETEVPSWYPCLDVDHVLNNVIFEDLKVNINIILYITSVYYELRRCLFQKMLNRSD